jgi:hypothetical protein
VVKATIYAERRCRNSYRSSNHKPSSC